MALTTLARKYLDAHSKNESETAKMVRWITGNAGYSAAHIYNVLRGTRKSRPLSALIEDYRSGKFRK